MRVWLVGGLPEMLTAAVSDILKRIWIAGIFLTVLCMQCAGISVQAADTKAEASETGDGDCSRDISGRRVYREVAVWVTDTLRSIIDADSMTELADGSYIPDKFGYSGGTGRVAIRCQEVTIREGRAYATLVFDSDSYSYVKVNGRVCEGANTADTSVFEIPVQLNRNNTVIGCTTKMSSAHEIAYSIFIYIEGAFEDAGEQPEGEPSQTESLEAPKIEGLIFKRETAAEKAELFKIFHYKGGIACIEVDSQTEDTGKLRYLIVPDKTEIPAGLDKEMVVIRRPGEENGEKRFYAYVASEPVLGWMEDLGQLKNLSLLGVPEEKCQIREVRNLLEEEKIIFGGTYDAIEYKMLVSRKCDLALMPAGMSSPGKDAKGAEGSSGEWHETYEEVSGYLSELGIPMFVDQSLRESTEEGQAEWIKVYGVLFDCEEEAGALYQEKQNGG